MTPAQQVETVLGVVTVRWWDSMQEADLYTARGHLLGWVKVGRELFRPYTRGTFPASMGPVSRDFAAAVCWVAEQQKGQGDG